MDDFSPPKGFESNSTFKVISFELSTLTSIGLFFKGFNVLFDDILLMFHAQWNLI